MRQGKPPDLNTCFLDVAVAFTQILSAFTSCTYII